MPPPDGQSWEWHDSLSHAIPGQSLGMVVRSRQQRGPNRGEIVGTASVEVTYGY